MGRTVRRTALLAGLAVLLAGFLLPMPADAQYFGRNKVQYDDFDFRRFETDHFEFFYYPEERQAVTDAARMAERWYQRHSRTFLREFQQKKPIIFYANDADFQQTNAIRGMIGQGTGGVTESIKERVIMPLTGVYGQTDHVLGHELVHSFQYDIALRGDVEGFSLRRLPLWLVEGMAEYLSIGRHDPHTAMWLRDAMLRDDLPTVEQMTNDQANYFPYRYGQAYSAYIGGKYGDAAVANLFKLSGRVGVDSAFVYSLGIQADSLSTEWKQAVRSSYEPLVQGRTSPDSVGQAVVGETGAERQLSISPAVSPDGRYVAYIGRSDVFTTNLLIADSETGEVVQRLQGTRSDPHFDALRFISTAGSWSPDGRKFAFITFVEGDNEINTLDVTTGQVERRISVQDIGAITNLAWSPDGNRIAFAGMEGGVSDLYVLNLESGAVRQLTNDRYADLQPTWSPDGETLAFTTDRGPDGTNFETLEFAKKRLGLIDVESGEIRTVRPFERGQQHNPQFAPDGRSLYFISDHDGFKDVYRYALDEEEAYRVTSLKTGVSGITALSPAMSVARQSGRLMFSVFANGGYTIRGLEEENAQGEPVTTTPRPTAEVDAMPAVQDVPAVGSDTTEGRNATVGGEAMAGLLPPTQSPEEGLVGSYLGDPITGLPDDFSPESSEYKNRLELDQIAPPSFGGSVGGPFGAQVSGGVGFFFSDMLGNQSLDVIAQANGTLKDIGGLVSYTNRGNRLNYNATAAHIPFRFGQVACADQFCSQGFQIIQRIYQTQLSVGSAYPFSQTRRLELNVGAVRYGFDQEVFEFAGGGRFVRRVDPSDAGFQEREALYLGQVGLAYVGDYSNFGYTSPLQGGRYRFEVRPLVGVQSSPERFLNVRLDYRRYLYTEPVTFAFRGLHIGNYGASLFGNGNSIPLGQEYLGDAYQQGFIRGYSFNSVLQSQAGDFDINRLVGTRLALASAEVRIPLTGTDALGLINFPYVPIELSAFTDAGIAWTDESISFNGGIPDIRLNYAQAFSARGQSASVGASRVARPLVSAGIAARFNVLGALILETYAAYPFQRPGTGWDLGLVLRPGW